MHEFAYAAAGVLYLAASVRHAIWFTRARPGSAPLAAALTYAGVLLHLTGTTLYWVRFDEPPLVGLGPSLATLALLIGLALGGLGFYAAARAVGIVLAPIAATLVGTALLIGLTPTGSAPIFRGPWLSLHVALSFIGYTGWVVAAAAAGMYLLQFRELKHKHLGAVFQFFPPLDTLDKLAEWSLVTGFSTLTLGVLLGWAWVLRFEPDRHWMDPKLIWGGLVWVVLSVALTARLSGRTTTREAAVWNVAGFGLVFVAYLVMKAIAPGTRFFL